MLMVNFVLWFRSSFSSIASLFLGFAVLFILVSACTPVFPDYLISDSTETVVPTRSVAAGVEPTHIPRSTQVEPPATPTPTQKPETRQFTHPDDFFELSIPDTWSVQLDGEVTQVNDPTSEVSIHVRIIDTIYELNQESLARLVDAREANAFGDYDDFIELDRQVNDRDDSYEVKKRLLDDGESKIVVTRYHQAGQFVLVLDMWSGQDYFDSNSEELASIVASLSSGESLAEAIENQSNLLSTFNNGSISIDVPQYWNYRSTLGENSIVDTFTSPDERAIIQMAVYDDGEPITGSVAGAFVRNLLRNYYAKDIVVTSYRNLPDGREELTWRSSGSNYEGLTYFDTRDTELYVYTVMMDADYQELYNDLLSQVLNSFQSLPSG